MKREKQIQRKRRAKVGPEIVTQKQIVDVIRQRSDLEFFHLVYACWSEAGKFGFDHINAYQWKNVLWRLKEWKQPPAKKLPLEHEMCDCLRMNHFESCPVRGFREAVATGSW